MRNPAAWIVSIASRIAPRDDRRAFRNEWDAELVAAARFGGPAASPARLALRALGAFPDALFLRRQQWRFDMMLQDLRQAWRVIVRRPAYAMTVAATLAVGIGAATAMYSVIDG